MYLAQSTKSSDVLETHTVGDTERGKGCHVECHLVQAEVNQALRQFGWHLHLSHVNNRGSGDIGGSRFQFCRVWLTIAGMEPWVERGREVE